MKRIAMVLYGALAYLAFLLPIAYLVAFLADVGVPRTVNRGAGPLGPALTIDVLLLLLFGLQHSIMARPGFKQRIRRWVPPSIERSTYVLVSGLVLVALFWLWRPIPALLWDATGTVLEPLAWAGFGLGWTVAVAATFALSHLHLFGVAQIAARVQGAEHPRLGLRTPWLYNVVRHPMTAGLILAFWSTPRMSVGHLVFALGMTLYCLVATVFEERDLLDTFHDAYRAYRRRVPALVPLLRPGLLAPRAGRLGWELSVLTVGIGALSLLLLSGVTSVAEAGPGDPGEAEAAGAVQGRTGVLRVKGVERSYRLFAPAGDGTAPRPLVLALHGTGGDARRFRGFLGGELERLAAARGWVVAYPEAWRGAWNDCRREARAAARAEGVDDVAFLRALVAHLAAEALVDPERVFLIGYSGGGHMGFRTALEAPDLVGAMAVFGSSLPTAEASLCEPRPGTPSVLVVNGTRDLINPFGGGDVIGPTGAFLGRVRSSPGTVAYLRGIAGMADGSLGPRADGWSGTVAGTEGTGRRDQPRIELVPVEGGGHAVPGQRSRFPSLVGRTVRSWEGLSAAVEFFFSGG